MVRIRGYAGHTTEKPETLTYLGSITIAEVRAAATVEEPAKLVRAWAESVWAAYAVQQDVARAWIKTALSGKDVAGTK